MSAYQTILKSLQIEGIFNQFQDIERVGLLLQPDIILEISTDLERIIKIAQNAKIFLANEGELQNFSSFDEVNFFLELANFLEQKNLVDLATFILMEASTLYPEETKIYANLAQLFLKVHAPQKAAISLREATMRDPENPDYWILASDVMRQSGDFEGAIKCLEKVFESDHQHQEARQKLASILAYLELYDGANDFLGAILEEDPENADVLHEKALLDFRQGRIVLEEIENQQNNVIWDHFDKRFSFKNKPYHCYPQLTNFQRWRGESLKDKIILVVIDQDDPYRTLLRSLLPGLVTEANYVKMELSTSELSTYAQSFPNTGFILTNDFLIDQKIYHFYNTLDLEGIDYWTPLSDLMRYRLSSYQKVLHCPYLLPASHRFEFWKEKLKPFGNQCKVGINPKLHPFFDPSWSQWQKLIKTPDCHFFCLDPETSPEDIKKYELEPCPYESDASFEEKTGFLAQLSFIIAPLSIETVLGAALGTKVMQLTPRSEWTMLGQEESPFFGNRIQVLLHSIQKPYDVQIPELVTKCQGILIKNDGSSY